MKRIYLFIYLLITAISLGSLLIYGGVDDFWVSCCKVGCDYTFDQFRVVGGTTYYCCENGWMSSPCQTGRGCRDTLGTCCRSGCEFSFGQSITLCDGTTYYCCENGWTTRPNMNLGTCCRSGCEFSFGQSITLCDGTTYYCCENGWTTRPNMDIGTCCSSGCKYRPGQSIRLCDGTVYYCCEDGWRTSPCLPTSSDGACSRGSYFSNRCPTSSTDIFLSCEEGKVCIYKIEEASVCDNVNRESNKINSDFYCIDKKPPQFVFFDWSHELISRNTDNTYDPFPNYYTDFYGKTQTLNPENIVIDKEYIEFKVFSNDNYNGLEISGIKSSQIRFTKSRDPESSIYPSVSSCPNGANYVPPIIHSNRFRNLDIGWGNLISIITDQAENRNTSSMFQIYVFLGARGDLQNQRSTDKLVFLKTYWDSSSELRSVTGNLGGLYTKRINCFRYREKCVQARDIIGKTDEFTDCLWVGPAPASRNVVIYNYKEIVDVDRNEKVVPQYFRDYGDKLVLAWENIAGPNLRRIAACVKNDTGILVDLPFLVSKNIKDGFQILPSTEKRFSVIWEVEYAREQRNVVVECYLNPNYYDPSLGTYRVCTVSDILNNLCLLDGRGNSQRCLCGGRFPCIQNTSKETINSCSVENPRYFSGINRIICKMYDPEPKGLEIEVWFNHDFYYVDGRIISAKNYNLEGIRSNVLEKILEYFYNILKIFIVNII